MLRNDDHDDNAETKHMHQHTTHLHKHTDAHIHTHAHTHTHTHTAYLLEMTILSAQTTFPLGTLEPSASLQRKPLGPTPPSAETVQKIAFKSYRPTWSNAKSVNPLSFPTGKRLKPVFSQKIAPLSVTLLSLYDGCCCFCLCCCRHRS